MKKHIMMIVLSVIIISLLLPNYTMAHSYVVESSPADKMTVTEVPETIKITFNAPIQTAFFSLEVLNDAGERVDNDESEVKESTLQNSLPKELANGSYTINWKIVSNDGHTMEGTQSFTLDAPIPVKEEGPKEITKEEPESVVEKKETTVQKETVDETKTENINSRQSINQFLLYIGFSLFAGVLLFHSILLPKNMAFNMNKRSKTLLWLGFLAMAISIIISLPIQVLSLTNEFSVSTTQQTLRETIFGTVWIIKAALLIILFLASIWATKQQNTSSLSVLSILLLGLMLAKSFIGHTMITDYKALAISMNFLHLASMAFWLGGLLALCMLLPTFINKTEQNELYWTTIQSFSRLATIFVSILLLSGVINTLQYLPSLNSLISTNYGLVLLAKIALVVIMILLGFVNWLRGKANNKPLQQNIIVEFAFGLFVLILAALLSNLPIA